MLVHVFSVREAYTKTNVNDLCRDNVLSAFSNVDCVLLTTFTNSSWRRFAEEKYNTTLVKDAI